MPTESKNTDRFIDAPRDKPQGDRVEHANLERPGAQAHPRAGRGEWATHARQRGWRVH